MRIRRYAARLASSGTAAPSSPPPPPPPPPAASWLHAAGDDCCAFCELSCPAPQEGPDAIKHKGHIAGLVPESDVNGDERAGLAQRPPVPEVKKFKVDHLSPVSKASAGLQALMGVSGVCGAAAKPEGATPVSEADADPAARSGPFVANGAAIEQGVKCGASLASDDPRLDVTTGNSLVNASSAELEVLKGISVANKVATDPVTDRVSLESKATTVLGIRSIVPEVIGAPSVMNESGSKLEVPRRNSFVNEASTEKQIVSSLGKPVTDQGVITTVPGVTGTGFLSTEGSVGPEVTGTPSGVPSRCDAGEAGGSVNPTTCVPVTTEGPTVEGGVPNDRSVTPSVSCVLDIVARSIGTSGRTDVICYARRAGKRKLELLEVKTENIELEDGVTCEEKETLERTGRCESALSTAGSADVKLADIKKELMDNSSANRVKKKKRNKFECNIDYCRMTFKTKAELSVHKKNMCTVKSCSRHFRSHRYLRRHQSIHSDDMPYKCPWDGCNMAFKWSWDRAEHFKVHAGMKPYKCTTPGCSRIYKFVSDFTRHRRRCKPQRMTPRRSKRRARTSTSNVGNRGKKTSGDKRWDGVDETLNSASKDYKKNTSQKFRSMDNSCYSIATGDVAANKALDGIKRTLEQAKKELHGKIKEIHAISDINNKRYSCESCGPAAQAELAAAMSAR
ncbi:hypothetical protein U9M48_006129 [Paspalum notatum var. saurae]|uniref:C2H2-type domain-containing protein n=1 Tax=Paspalum notatum var. saurae TaxID=547442 RepID=A0AAQ3SM39_PASNO